MTPTRRRKPKGSRDLIQAATAASQEAIALVDVGHAGDALRRLASDAHAGIQADGCEGGAAYAERLRAAAPEASVAEVTGLLAMRHAAFVELGLERQADLARAALVAITEASGRARPARARSDAAEAPTSGDPAAEACELDDPGACGAALVAAGEALTDARPWEALRRLRAIAADPRPDVMDVGEERAAVVGRARAGAHLASWSALTEVLVAGGCDRGARWLAEESVALGLRAVALGADAPGLPDATRALMVLAFLEDDVATVLHVGMGSIVKPVAGDSWLEPLGSAMIVAAMDVHAHALIRSSEPIEYETSLLAGAVDLAHRQGARGLVFPAPFYEVALAGALAREGACDGRSMKLYRRALLIDPAAIAPLPFWPCGIEGLDEMRRRLHARLAATRLVPDVAAIEARLPARAR